MTKLIRLLLAAGLLLPLAPMAAQAAQTAPPDPITTLQQAERDRITAMNRVATTRGLPAPRALPTDAGATACLGGPAVRQVAVSTADMLVRALADARPGDQIRLADGVYKGAFVATASGTEAAPITLCGTRAAVLEGHAQAAGYGLHLTGSYWTLAGFTVRNAQKGIMLDGANHNMLRGLEITQIGDEGVHFRAGSSDNRLEQSWIHLTGRHTATFGEGVYIGTAQSNWKTISGGQPDRSDRNQVLNNVIGPNTRAENIDVKEGTSGGVIQGNTFSNAGMTAAHAWVNVKGNGYTVTGNVGLILPASGFKAGIVVNVVAPGWGAGNTIRDNVEQTSAKKSEAEPFRMMQGTNGPVSIVLPPRALPYSLTELRAYFPASVAPVAPGVVLVTEHILVAHNARLTISDRDAHEIRLLSTSVRFVSLVAYRGALTLSGSDASRLTITSWDPAANGPDRTPGDGRAYVLVRGGRLDLDRVDTADLGFGDSEMAGVAWRGTSTEPSQGTVADSGFRRNASGALAQQATGMHWTRNTIADNLGHGLALYSVNDFLLEGNNVFGNRGHGIYCARGCTGNTLRLNTVTANQKQGIVLKAGTTATGAAIPANNNQVAQNQLRQNQVGLVLDGGSGNVIRNNDIQDNRFGVRLTNGATDNLVAGNAIQRSALFAMQIAGQADHNRVIGNIMQGGQSGVVVSGAAGTVVGGNIIGVITGQGIVLDPDALDATVGYNMVDDQASRAAGKTPGLATRHNRATRRHPAPQQAAPPALTSPPGPAPADLPATAWSTLQQHPAVTLWVIIFLLPVLAWLWARTNVGLPKLTPAGSTAPRRRFWQRGRRAGKGG